MNCYLAEQFNSDLFNLINTSGLSMPTVYYIVKNLLHELTVQYNSQIIKDKENLNSAAEEIELNADSLKPEEEVYEIISSID